MRSTYRYLRQIVHRLILNTEACEIFVLLGSKSKCEKHRQEVYDTFPVVNGEKLPMPGAYVPQCNKDGSYKEEQCHGSTGYCWCVDENGKKREETQVKFKKPNCKKGESVEVTTFMNNPRRVLMEWKDNGVNRYF